MPQPSLPEFLQNLERSKLLSASRLKKLRDKLPENVSSTQTAEQLVQARYLTQWQAKQLLKGETGFVLGQYRLLNPVGRGGMGHVFRAADSSNGQIVAVKVMARALSSNETLVSRFRREIRATQQLNNPHIVKTLDAGRVGKIDFMVMEFVNGEQLDRICNRHNRLPVGIACEMIRQVSVGLQHASEKGMVHRDIKPANIMVHWDENGSGTAKLMDMGLVLLTSENVDEKTVTRAGQVMGTPDYMSPEQGWDTTQVDCRSDIYSLGCALFRMLTGTIPFQGSNPLQVLSQRLQRDAPPVNSVCTDIPVEVSDVVAKMTRRDPDQRFQTPSQLAAALQPFCETIQKSSLASLPSASESSDSAVAENSGQAVEDNDGTYRQFLKEVQEGTSVDLIDDFTLDGEAAETIHSDEIAGTIPIVKPEDTPAIARTRTRSKQRESRIGLITLAAGGLFVVLLAIIAVLTNGGTDADEDNANNATNQEQPAETPFVEFANTDTLNVPAGKTLTHQLDVTGSKDVRFQLDQSAPVEATINESTGEITWPVRRAQTPDVYRLKVRAYLADEDSTQSIGETTVNVNVTPNQAPLPVPRRLFPVQLSPDELFEFSVSSDELQAAKRPVEFTAKGRIPAGLNLNPESGLLSWTPQLADVGRHEIQVVYRDTETNLTEELPLRLIVVPNLIQHILPSLPTLSVNAGEELKYKFPATGNLRPRRFDADKIFRLGPDAPDGVTIQNNLLTWNVPESISGEVLIPIQASLKNLSTNREIEMKGIAQLTVVVSPGRPANSGQVPPPDQIAAASQRLRKTYERAFTVARTTTQKNDLAARLLMESDQSVASAEDYALLQLIESELAAKTRNVYALFEIARLKAERYAEDEIKMAVDSTQSFRRSSVTPMMQSLLLERGMQLALKALNADRLDEVKTLIDFSNTVLGRASAGMNRKLAGDLKAALKLANDLDQTTVGELNRILAKWQFESIFNDLDTSVYAVLMTNGQTIYADNGRSLWKSADDNIRLKGQVQPIMVSMIDSQKFGGEYLIRFEVSPDTNCLQMLVGGASDSEGQFDALKLILQKEGFGQLGRMNGTPPLVSAAAAKTPRLNADSWNYVEIAISENSVLLRVNGQLVFTTQPDQPIDGMLGIVANLQNQPANLNVRRARILVLP